MGHYDKQREDDAERRRVQAERYKRFVEKKVRYPNKSKHKEHKDDYSV